MGFTILNGVYGTVQTQSNTGATTVVLNTGQGAAFASASVANPVRCAVIDTTTNPETLKFFLDVTGVSTDTVTVTNRGAESTTDANALVGYTVAAVSSAGVLNAGAATLTDRGLWTASTAYVRGDFVNVNDTRYICAVAHTSGTTFATTNWTAVADTTPVASKLAFGSRQGGVIPLGSQSATIGAELWQLANFQGGFNTTQLAPSLTGNSTNQTKRTRIFIGNMANGDTSFRLAFDYTFTLDSWGGISFTLGDAGAGAITGITRQYLVAAGTTNKSSGRIIVDFKSPALSTVSYFELQIETVNNSTTGTVAVSNVSFMRTGQERSRPVLVTKDGAGGSYPNVYFQAFDDKTRTWRIAELRFQTDGSLTPAYGAIYGYTTDAIFNGGKLAFGDMTFAASSPGVIANPDSPTVSGATAYQLRSNNNDQVIEVLNGSSVYELRGNTHGGEAIRGSATYNIDTGSGLTAWTLASGLRSVKRFQVILPTTMSYSTGGSFANVDHTFTAFPDGVIRCDRTTTFTATTTIQHYFEWMSSHPTDRGYLGRIGRGQLVLGEIDTLSKLAVPAAPTLATSTTGGTLAAATYFYKVTKLTAWGETTGSTTTSQATTGTTSSNTVSWTADANATGYGVYRGSVTGQETLIAYVPAGTTSYVDTNAAAPQPGKFPPVKNQARLYNSAIDTQNIASADVTWAAFYDVQTGWAYGNIYDRDSPLSRSGVGNVRTRLEGATANIQKNYANLEWSAADTASVASGTVYTATHYSFAWCPVDAVNWHNEIAARAANLTALATMYPAT